MNDADFAHDHAVLPPLEQLYGEETQYEIDLEAMLAVAFDPATPAPEGELIPDAGVGEVDLAEFADDATSPSDPAPVDAAEVAGDTWGAAEEEDLEDPLSGLEDELDPSSPDHGVGLGDLEDNSRDLFETDPSHHGEAGGSGYGDDIQGL